MARPDAVTTELSDAPAPYSGFSSKGKGECTKKRGENPLVTDGVRHAGLGQFIVGNENAERGNAGAGFFFFSPVLFFFCVGTE